jgi:23S rRNA pseudouridine2605 synthase
LLLLTNDGDLALRLTHPRYGIRKLYRAKVRGVPSNEALQRLAHGVYLEEGKTAPAEVRLLDSRDGKSVLEISLTEGRRHEVRRMCLQVGHPVEKLRRIALGPLKLGKLAPGMFRDLTEAEVIKLRRAVGL